MSSTKPNANAIPTVRFFALLTLCVMAAILTSSCNKDQNSRREASPASSESSAKSPIRLLNLNLRERP